MHYEEDMILGVHKNLSWLKCQLRNDAPRVLDPKKNRQIGIIIRNGKQASTGFLAMPSNI